MLYYLRSTAEAVPQAPAALADLEWDSDWSHRTWSTEGNSTALPAQRCSAALRDWEKGLSDKSYIQVKIYQPYIFAQYLFLCLEFYMEFLCSPGWRSSVHPHPLWWSSPLSPQRLLINLGQQVNHSRQPPPADYLRQLRQQETQTGIFEVCSWDYTVIFWSPDVNYSLNSTCQL